MNNTDKENVACFTLVGESGSDLVMVGLQTQLNGDLRVALGAAQGVTKGTCKRIAFVPLYTEAYRVWLAEHPMRSRKRSKGDDTYSKIDYMKNFSSGASADDAWCSGRCGEDYITMAVLFSCPIAPLYSAMPVRTQFSFAPELHAELTAALSEIYGAENVFVSRQVLTTPRFIARHAEFAMQAKDAIARGERYSKSTYNDQEYPAFYPNMATYCIPVSVRKMWPRELDVEVATRDIEALKAVPTLAPEFWPRLGHSMHEKASVLPKLSTVPSIADMYSDFLSNCEKEASEPSPPSLLSRFKTLFRRKGE